MTKFGRILLIGALGCFGVFHSWAQDQPLLKIAVDSPALLFSPGNWTGDAGRSGKLFRQTWYPGAYFRATWTTSSAEPVAELLLDISSLSDRLKDKPVLTYCIDGVWVDNVACAERIKIAALKGAGNHTLTVYFKTSEQTERWGTSDVSGTNVVRITGLEVDKTSKPLAIAPNPRWALLVGDSITEGSAADFGKSDNLASWSYFVGTGLQSLGYEYGVSACGYSGWICPGDRSRDVPPYFAVSKSQNGTGGTYDDARSRWNKIDARNSLLDTAKQLSAYGQPHQEPALILINFGTNDALSKANSSDLQASITQSLLALQKAAPRAAIVVLVPFGQYAITELKAGIAACEVARPIGKKIILLDLGAPIAKGLEANGYWSGLHPNMRGHATFAAQILARIVPLLAAPR